MESLFVIGFLVIAVVLMELQFKSKDLRPFVFLSILVIALLMMAVGVFFSHTEEMEGRCVCPDKIGDGE